MGVPHLWPQEQQDQQLPPQGSSIVPSNLLRAPHQGDTTLPEVTLVGSFQMEVGLGYFTELPVKLCLNASRHPHLSPRLCFQGPNPRLLSLPVAARTKHHRLGMT